MYFDQKWVFKSKIANFDYQIMKKINEGKKFLLKYDIKFEAYIMWMLKSETEVRDNFVFIW